MYKQFKFLKVVTLPTGIYNVGDVQCWNCANKENEQAVRSLLSNDAIEIIRQSEFIEAIQAAVDAEQEYIEKERAKEVDAKRKKAIAELVEKEKSERGK